MSDITLLIPPFTQLNTPYPSILYLNRYLTEQGFSCTVRDISIELVDILFSSEVLAEIFAEIEEDIEDSEYPDEVWSILSQKQRILSVMDDVRFFLQGKRPSLQYRIFSGGFLPKTPRLTGIDLSYFGTMGVFDGAKYMCTLFVEDLVDLIKCCIDIGFDFGKYQAYLATGTVHFDPIIERIEATTIIDEYIDALTDSIEASCVALSLPFAGTVYAGLRMAKRLKKRGTTVWLGGGYVNTELRNIKDPRIWEYCDAICFDDGEEPLLNLLLRQQGKEHNLIRTLTAEAWFGNEEKARNPFTASADYTGLDLSPYLNLLDSLNPALIPETVRKVQEFIEIAD